MSNGVLGNWIWAAPVILALLGLYLANTAGRLDRLHGRVDGSGEAMDAQLVRRAAVAAELAGSGLLDPATSAVLGLAATEAREADPEQRAQAESDLTRALDAALPDAEEVSFLEAVPEGAAMLDEVTRACHRAQLARRFHNDAVRACRDVRAHRSVMWFRLYGHAPLPDPVDFDDAVPSGLAARLPG